jgi:hypothetical protein
MSQLYSKQLHPPLDITGSLYGTASYATTASYAMNGGGGGGSISTSGTTLYSTSPSAGSGFNTTHGIFFGSGSGYQATNALRSIFLGYQAGYRATNSDSSNFIGYQAGYSASSAPTSNFIGYLAGYNAKNATNSNFLGLSAGYSASNANNSNFIGTLAGYSATYAISSNFIGPSAGFQAVSASYSTLIGYHVGYNVAGGALGIKSNNIIIGTNITLPDNTKDSINLGGIIFATGSYATTTGNPYSGSAGGKVGINVASPQYTLDVSGSGNYTNGLTVTGSFQFPSGSNTWVGTATLTSGSALVNNTTITANSLIFLTTQTVGGTPGALYIGAKTAATSFAVSSSSNTDTSTFAYFIIN